MVTAYVGFTTVANPKWLNFLPEPTAPSNYKDEVKIREYIEKAKAGLSEKAANTPLCGSVKDSHVIVHEGVTGISNFDKLCSVQCVIGFRIFDYLDLSIIGVIDTLGELPERYRWAKIGKMIKTNYLPDNTGRLHPKVIFDPVSALVGEYEDKDLPAIMQRFGLCGALDTAATRAEAAKALAKKLGL